MKERFARVSTILKTSGCDVLTVDGVLFYQSNGKAQTVATPSADLTVGIGLTIIKGRTLNY